MAALTGQPFVNENKNCLFMFSSCLGFIIQMCFCQDAHQLAGWDKFTLLRERGFKGGLYFLEKGFTKRGFMLTR